MVKLAVAATVEDGTLTVSSSSALMASLRKRLREAESATLRILLDGPGRFSAAYTAAAADQAVAQAALDAAAPYELSMSYAGTSAFYPDELLLVDDELVSVRQIMKDSFEAGRGLYGTARATHAVGADVLPALLQNGVPVVTVELVVTGSPISSGVKGDIELPFAGTITAARLLADTSGDVVVDIWKSAYSAFPPVLGGSITAAAKPTLSAAQKYQDTTLTGWTTAFAAGDVLRVNVDSASGLSRVTLSLTCLKG